MNNSKNGFSLVETMIAGAIAAGTFLALSTMSKNQMESNKFLEFQLKYLQLQNMINGQETLLVTSSNSSLKRRRWTSLNKMN